MTSVIEVRFKGNRREYFTWSDDSSSLRLDTPVIVEVERGQDFGVVSALGAVAEKKCQRCGACGGAEAEGEGPETAAAPRAILRTATPEDRKIASDLRINEEDVRRTVRDRVRQDFLISHRHEEYAAQAAEVLEGRSFRVARAELEAMLRRPVSSGG